MYVTEHPLVNLGNFKIISKLSMCYIWKFQNYFKIVYVLHKVTGTLFNH